MKRADSLKALTSPCWRNYTADTPWVWSSSSSRNITWHKSSCVFVFPQTNPYYVKPRLADHQFGIKHYAGEVWTPQVCVYVCFSVLFFNLLLCLSVGLVWCEGDFREEQRHVSRWYTEHAEGQSVRRTKPHVHSLTLWSPSHLRWTRVLFCACRLDFIYDLFEQVNSRNNEETLKMGTARKKPTVSSQFRVSWRETQDQFRMMCVLYIICIIHAPSLSLDQDSLHSLMATLSVSNPFFVRCIKPNMDKVREPPHRPIRMQNEIQFWFIWDFSHSCKNRYIVKFCL